jgi:26S proteasome regulatory subunit (ATPase 3-interacting protein)
MAPKAKNDPKADVLQLLRNKNRPFSSTSLVDELHGEYPKGVVQKALDVLSAEGSIVCKLCGKETKLYFPNQTGLPVANPEELARMDAQVDQLRQTAAELKQKVDSLRVQRNRLVHTKPIPELIAYRDQLRQQVSETEARKNELVQMAEGISPEDAARYQKEFRTRCEQWKQRKNKCQEILDTLSDAADKKPKQLIEELELETDEQHGIKLEFRDKQFHVIE